MYPILLCSIIALAIMIERFLQIRRASRSPSALVRQVRAAISRNDLTAAVEECRTDGGPLSSIILAGLSKVARGEEHVRRAIEHAGELETTRLEKHITILATIVGGAPLLGFLGTVLGMIEAFRQIETRGGNVDASVLAGGIWEALLTTAAGLSVAVVTYFAHNFIVGRIRGIVFAMEESSESVLDTLFQAGAKR